MLFASRWASAARHDGAALRAYVTHASQIAAPQDTVHATLRRYLTASPDDSERARRRKLRMGAKLAFLNPGLEWPKVMVAEDALAGGRYETAARALQGVPAEGLDASMLLALAKAHLSNGEHERAGEIVTDASRRGADPVLVLFWRALASGARDALPSFCDAVRARGVVAPDHLLHGILQLSAGQVAPALGTFSRIADHFPVAARLGASLCAEATGDLTFAANLLLEEQRASGANASVLSARARLAHRSGDTKTAVALYEAACALEPRNLTLRMESALAQLDDGVSSDQLVDTLISLRARGCRDERLLDALGRAHAEAGRFDEAFECWSAISAPGPETLEDMAACRHHLALHQLESGDIRGAAKSWNEIPSAIRDRPEIRKGIRAARRRWVVEAMVAGDSRKAWERAEKACSDDPGDERLYLLRAVALMATDLGKAAGILAGFQEPVAALLFDVSLLLLNPADSEGPKRLQRLRDAGGIWRRTAAVLARDFDDPSALGTEESLLTDRSLRLARARALHRDERFEAALSVLSGLEHPSARAVRLSASLKLAASQVETARFTEAVTTLNRAYQEKSP